MEAIKISNLRKEFKDTVAVKNLNLEIEEGELFSLLGVNGAGKTTTIKMLATLTKPTSGEASIFGYYIGKDDDKIKEIIDISMQETAVARKLTVEENNAEIDVKAEHADGEKCERCWMYSTTVGEDKENPTICRRCSEVLKD